MFGIYKQIMNSARFPKDVYATGGTAETGAISVETVDQNRIPTAVLVYVMRFLPFRFPPSLYNPAPCPFRLSRLLSFFITNTTFRRES